MAAAKRHRASRSSRRVRVQRILRIGVLLGGKIVEERLIRERAPVSIGQSMKNTFSMPVEGLPLELTLFALDEGKYYLRFLNKMDGRLSDGRSGQHARRAQGPRRARTTATTGRCRSATTRAASCRSAT